MLPYILVISGIIIIFILLFYSSKLSRIENTPVLDRMETGKPCPICSWPLQKNERVHSIRYQTGSDALMHIYGCPYCYKEHPKSKFSTKTVRKCPSCNSNLQPKDYVIARLFEKPGKNHVHVLGCYRCRGKR
ncbi:MAG: hypothetical protein JXR64_05245 [Spirochaetales bacterium]|nr:hypothetical protein [Spirochaetales bacterium]